MIHVVSYFTDAEEALHLAVSRDGQEFSPVNDGEPVLRGTVGTRSLRDPFIGVGPEGFFHLLATDGWTSQSIVHATSTDLFAWSEQELLPVMAGVEGAHNAWAPEFFHDREQGVYHLIWSSVVDSGITADSRVWENTSQDHRIWHCTTADFLTFSPSSLFFDPGYSVIDATVKATENGFLMAFKDERGANDPAARHKHIHITTFATPGGPYSEPTGPVTPPVVEGPSIYRRGDEWVLMFDHFLEGRYGAASSTDGLTWNPTTVSLPGGMRHASVLSTPYVPHPLV